MSVKLNRNKLILAFPGMGKTPLSFIDGKYRDVDFGTFRTALGCAKENESVLLPVFAKYLQALDADWANSVIMTNEPTLADYVRIDHMYLPTGAGMSYSAKKLGVSLSQVIDWVSDWAEVAKRHNIPVTYLSVGLDHYKGAKRRAEVGIAALRVLSRR